MSRQRPDLRPLVQDPNGKPPLDGVRVVDFTRVMAGPFGTQILGDLGADVIKIENPVGGDDTRSVRRETDTGGETPFFMSLNRSKRSVAIDLKSAEGRKIVLDLIATADILVENFTGSVMRRFELDYPSLRERFPKLIYCSISGYGRSGKNADAAGYDSPLGAEAGVTGLNKFLGGTPVLGGIPYTDISTALNSTIGILAALHARSQTGRGQHVDIAMFDSALANLSYQGCEFLATGGEPLMFNRQTFGPSGVFETADGNLVITCGKEKMFQSLCRHVVDRPDWLEDPRFSTAVERARNEAAFLAEIVPLFQSQPSAVWTERCKAAGIPCGAVRSIPEALLSDEAAERGLVFGIPHPTAGLAPAIAQPYRFSELQCRYGTPPLLGQHTQEVLGALDGYGADRIGALADTGIIALGKQAAK